MTEFDSKLETAGKKEGYFNPISNRAYVQGFIDGGKSSEAKEHWQKEIGQKISDIINQDGDDTSDGECIDLIVQYLKSQNTYQGRKEFSSVSPCPFCSKEPFEGRNKDGKFVIKCYECGVEMVQDRKDKVIGMWNTRIKRKR